MQNTSNHRFGIQVPNGIPCRKASKSDKLLVCSRLKQFEDIAMLERVDFGMAGVVRRKLAKIIFENNKKSDLFLFYLLNLYSTTYHSQPLKTLNQKMGE